MVMYDNNPYFAVPFFVQLNPRIANKQHVSLVTHLYVKRDRSKAGIFMCKSVFCCSRNSKRLSQFQRLRNNRNFSGKNVQSGTGPHLVCDPRTAQLKTRLLFQPTNYALLSTENTFTHKLTVLCSQAGYWESASKKYISIMYTITCRREKTH